MTIPKGSIHTGVDMVMDIHTPITDTHGTTETITMATLDTMDGHTPTINVLLIN